MSKRNTLRLGESLLVVLAMFFTLGVIQVSAESSGAPGADGEVTSGMVRPVSGGDLSQASQSEADLGQLQQRHAARRDRTAIPAPYDSASEASEAPSPSHDLLSSGAGEAGESSFLKRNNRNTRAQVVSSTLAEPAAANRGNEVLYTGNTYVSTSTNAGSSWVGNTLPAGPAQAQFACCDQDLVRAHSKDSIFHVVLYLNGNGTRGVARIYVRRGVIGTSAECSYLAYDPGTNRVPDYPHIAVSNGFLFLTSADFNTKGTASTADDVWFRSVVRRFNLSQMATCVTTAVSTFTYVGSVGQRTFVPAESVPGSTNIMYWGSHENSTTMRIFVWNDASASPAQFLRSGVQGTNFINPDCRGGTGNFDFIQRSSAWDIRGYRHRSAVGAGKITFYWNAAQDGHLGSAHVHGVVLRQSDLAILSQPRVVQTNQCIGYPVIGTNFRGDVGLTGAIGGKPGGGGTAAQGFIAVDDFSTGSLTFPFAGAGVLTASGTHNRSDGRFGDYFTARTNAKCSRTWVATNFALLNGNTSPAHVNARYIEFGSSQDSGCMP